MQTDRRCDCNETDAMSAIPLNTFSFKLNLEVHFKFQKHLNLVRLTVIVLWSAGYGLCLPQTMG